MKFTAKVKKILAKDRFSNCAYIYRDGIVIKEDAEATVNGLTFKTELWHIVPFTEEIKFNISAHWDDAYYAQRKEFKGRYVVHNPTLLIDGINRVEIYMNNASDKSKELGIHCDTITLTTDSGMKIRVDCLDCFTSDMCLQNDRVMSILDFDTYEYRERTIWHGNKPEQAIAV